ncbi:mandelate racemase/muconate lactonizing enzyme family protein [Microbacterium sp. A196]|uniref:mandelate racemase/muconate lactonizing enzyme family protein n=1 Tax=Microbacterium sp. A196 TaxID=3457320 RepID=UPI003FD54BE1
MAANLRIAAIEVFQLDLPYSGGVYRLSGGREYRSFDATFVRITTDGGIEGWGESTPFGANYVAAHAGGVRSGIAEIAPHLIGSDPRRVDRINDTMDAALLGHEHAKTALDVACWDLFGKSVGLPVCELLGGRTDQRMPLISSIPMGSPEQMRSQVEKYRSMGYRAHSLKIGGDPREDAERLIAALAEQRAGEYFIVDANGGMTVETASRMLRLLPDGLDFVLEAPCATWRECVSLRRRTTVPIIMDELATSDASIAQLVADDAAEGFGIKITKNGGLTRSRRQRDIGTAAGLTSAIWDSAGSDVAFAAILHLGQSFNPRYLRGVWDIREMSDLRTADGPFDVADGWAVAPDRPGLGVTPRLDVLGDPVATYS